MTTTIDLGQAGRVAVMWAEAGVQFRANIVRLGGVIGLHAHRYDHVALVTSGWFMVREVRPGGEVLEYQMAAKDFLTADARFAPVGYRVTIPAWHRHEFTCLGGESAEVLCLWGEGHDAATLGEDSC